VASSPTIVQLQPSCPTGKVSSIIAASRNLQGYGTFPPLRRLFTEYFVVFAENSA
jgi:hypothetical protein